MRSGSAFLVTLLVLVSWRATVSAQGPPTQKPTAEAPKNYSSPIAVFDAYREAIAKRDTRTQLFCLTPEIRDAAVFEAFFACNMRLDKPPVIAVLKKFGVEPSVLEAEFYKRYKEKHGVDLAKLFAEYEEKLAKAIADYRAKNKTGSDDPTVPSFVMQQVEPPPQPQDPELYRKIVIEKVVDKVGFVVAAEDAVRNPDCGPSPLGPLKNVRVRGDTAVGEAAATIYMYSGGPGGDLLPLHGWVSQPFGQRPHMIC